VTARKATGAEEKKVISEGPWQGVSSVTQAATHSTEASQQVTAFNGVRGLRRVLDHWK